MFINQPVFPQNPFDLIISKKNKRLAKVLLSNGMEPGKIKKIWERFYSDRVVMREISNHINNPEWLELRAWVRTVVKQYTKAIRSFEMLLNDDSIPSIIPQPGTIEMINKDIEELKDRKHFLTFITMSEPLGPMTPAPKSINQMIIFQSFALFKYLKNFQRKPESEYRQSSNKEPKEIEMNKKAITKPISDNEIYNFIAELFQNLYKNTVLDSHMKNITGDILKRNFIDNADKLTSKKYGELEKIIKPFISKTS